MGGLVASIEQIPGELISLEGEEFARFVAQIAGLKIAVQAWVAGEKELKLNRAEIRFVRRMLAKCPDQFPSPTTHELTFIADAALRESIRLDISATNQDLMQGEWKGATVLAGSAIEALLLWAVQEYAAQKPGAVMAAGQALVAAGTLMQPPRANPERWELHEFVETAAHLTLIKGDTPKLVRLAKDFRNLIHPGRAQRLGQKCDRSTALAAVAALEAVVRDLTPGTPARTHGSDGQRSHPYGPLRRRHAGAGAGVGMASVGGGGQLGVRGGKEHCQPIQGESPCHR